MAPSHQELAFLPPFAFRDSGPPPKSNDYTTILMIHGLGFHSANFLDLLPPAAEKNLRVIAINRRDMPGSTPYSDAEKAQLLKVGTLGPEEGCLALESFMRERVLEIYQFLTTFILKEHIPKKNGSTGGINLVAWSFSAIWLLSFLSEVKSFPPSEVDLTSYMRCVSFYDPPYHSFGWPHPAKSYSPMFDSSIDPNDRAAIFMSWISGYFDHGEDINNLELRKPKANPPPSLANMSQTQLRECFHGLAVSPDGSDSLHLYLGIQTGLNLKLRNKVLAHGSEWWDKLPIKYLWCDSSLWEMVYGAELLSQYLKAKEQGLNGSRPVEIMKIVGANHFLHYDDPRKLLDALILCNRLSRSSTHL